MKNAIFYLPMADELFGPDAIVPYGIYLQTMNAYGFNIITFPFHLPYAPQIFLVVVLGLAFLYLFGTFRVFTGIMLYAAVTVLRFRNGFILDGSDNVIQVTMPFLIFADAYRYFRVNLNLPKVRLLRYRLPNVYQKVARTVSYYALIGLLVQVCYVYFFTALAKLQGDLWLNGTATYYTMRVDEFRATHWNIPLTENHYFVVLSTYFTILFEIAFAFLIWFRNTKYFIIAMGVLLHIGIWIFMRIDNFSWIMIGTYFLFITDQEYQAFYRWLRTSKLPTRLINKTSVLLRIDIPYDDKVLNIRKSK